MFRETTEGLRNLWKFLQRRINSQPKWPDLDVVLFPRRCQLTWIPVLTSDSRGGRTGHTGSGYSTRPPRRPCSPARDGTGLFFSTGVLHTLANRLSHVCTCVPGRSQTLLARNRETQSDPQERHENWKWVSRQITDFIIVQAREGSTADLGFRMIWHSISQWLLRV